MTGRRASGGGEFANVGHVTLANRTELPGEHRHHGKRVTRERHELNLVGFSATMNMHHGADITGFKALAGKVGSQNYAIVLVDVHWVRG
jgi:hypothetical protein